MCSVLSLFHTHNISAEQVRPGLRATGTKKHRRESSVLHLPIRDCVVTKCCYQSHGTGSKRKGELILLQLTRSFRYFSQDNYTNMLIYFLLHVLFSIQISKYGNFDWELLYRFSCTSY